MLLSFSDEDVFKGVALPEETPIIPPKEVTFQSAQPTPAGIPIREATIETMVKLLQRRGLQTSSLAGRECYTLPDL